LSAEALPEPEIPVTMTSSLPGLASVRVEAT
jgi:hypothetical protein